LHERITVLLPLRRGDGAHDSVDMLYARDHLADFRLGREDHEGLDRARRDPSALEGVASYDRISLAGKVLGLRLARIELEAEDEQQGDDRRADGRDRPRTTNNK